jgi:hypothetical protein
LFPLISLFFHSFVSFFAILSDLSGVAKAKSEASAKAEVEESIQNCHCEPRRFASQTEAAGRGNL